MTEATQDEALRLADWHQAMAEEPKRNEAKREKHRATAAELRRQHALLNSPELLSFRDGVVQEAAHQRERWGTQHDGGKTPEDWFWLVGYLAGRALEHNKEAERLEVQLSYTPADFTFLRDGLSSNIAYHREKAVHHCITTAAACANWHAAVVGKINMRPGIGMVVSQETNGG